MKPALLAVSLLITVAPAVAGERARNPSDAVVLIRLTGSISAQLDGQGQRNIIDRDRVEIGSGSGFVISPYGYVLTNEHVVGPTEIPISDGLRRGSVTLKPTKIEVCFPPDSAAARGTNVRCSEASIVAADSLLDLALLSVSASNLPYLALGDSDVVTPGQSAQALGFPFGQQLSLNAPGLDGRGIPEMTTTNATISALRSDAFVERRLLQISASVNPGNSGGPLTDNDGFAIGVVQSRLRNATGIAFAIPINLAKLFFDSHGLNQLIPGRQLNLGPVHTLEAKGLSLRLPNGFADASALRLRVEAASRDDELSLRIDRVFSPLSIRQLEQQLIGTQTFERLSTISHESRSGPGAPSTSLLGQATATGTDTGSEVRLVYAIVDLGPEKLLARYVGSTEQVAFNESVLRASLASVEAQRIIVGDVAASIARVQWPASETVRSMPAFPTGWLMEPSAPSPCDGIPLANAQSAASPPQDFTFMLRAAAWTTLALTPEDAAAACTSRRGSLGAASYAAQVEWMGVQYAIEGAFVRVGGSSRILQMEVLSTDSKAGAARALLAAWVKRTTE